MTAPLDPDVAQAVVAALGFAGRDDTPADLAASAQPGPPTAQAARRALAARAWVIKDRSDLTAITAALIVIAAATANETQLAAIEAIGREMT